jgi:hypothetical protein
MTFWKITGETSDDSGNAPSALFAVTPDDLSPPDPDGALELTAPGRAWTRLERIERVATLPDAWDADAPGPLNDVVKQLASATDVPSAVDLER